MAETVDLAQQYDSAEALSDVLSELEDKSNRFGHALTSALSGALSGSKGLDDVLRGLALRMSSIALQAGLKPLDNLISNGLSAAFGSLSSVSAFAQGGVPGKVIPFAEGGVVSQPMFFPMGGSDIGLMGEAGAEAILPLKRGSDGSLGVAASGSAAPQIIFNVTATDAQSFRKSEAQISAMVSRSVMRGQRNL
jgi:phage-related minor tail protein